MPVGEVRITDEDAMKSGLIRGDVDGMISRRERGESSWSCPRHHIYRVCVVAVNACMGWRA